MYDAGSRCLQRRLHLAKTVVELSTAAMFDKLKFDARLFEHDRSFVELMPVYTLFETSGAVNSTDEFVAVNCHRNESNDVHHVIDSGGGPSAPLADRWLQAT